MPVVEEISACDATPGKEVRQSAAGSGRHQFEARAVEIPKEQRPLFIRSSPIILVRFRIRMTVGHEQVKPAIIVVIEKDGSPA